MSFINNFQPYRLYTVLFLSICYFVAQIILSNITHALTLQMALNHMLCNILLLAGSLLSIKHKDINSDPTPLDDNKHKHMVVHDKNHEDPAIPKDANAGKYKARELKTRNTFGWIRIEVLTMLIVCVTLTSLSLALLCEALQTLVHIEHEDSMHLPVHVMILGCVGLLLHGFTYFAIGGYTTPQGSFLHINPNNGQVIVEPSNITQGFDEKSLVDKHNSMNDHRLREDLKAELGQVHYRTRRGGYIELLRDVSTTIFFMVCAIIVHVSDDKEHTAKFIDPVLSIFSLIMVGSLSYPYMKDACLILLQTIPAHIDMVNFESTLKTKFPEIDSLHDLHVWQLTPHKYIATVHIIFKSSKLYGHAINNIRAHFHSHSIAQVTIQPEFYNGENTCANNTASKECLLQCKHAECVDKVCCTESITTLRKITVCPGEEEGAQNSHTHHGHSHGHTHGKHDLNHSHTHTTVDGRDNTINPTANEATPKEMTDPTKMEIITTNIDQIQKLTTESSIPSSVTLQSNVNQETSDESSSNDKSKDETETADLTERNVSELLETAMPSTEIIDQTTSDNTKC